MSVDKTFISPGGNTMNNFSEGVKERHKRRSLVERELETNLTARVTSPVNANRTSTGRLGRQRTTTSENNFLIKERSGNDNVKSSNKASSISSPISRMYASNSPSKKECQVKPEHKIVNSSNDDVAINIFEKNSSPPAKKIKRKYTKKDKTDLVQNCGNDSNKLIDKHLSPKPSQKPSTSKQLNNTLETSSEKYNLKSNIETESITSKSPQNQINIKINGLINNKSVVKTLDFDSVKNDSKIGKPDTKTEAAQEKILSIEAECCYQVEDLAWARVGNYPFWPCIVTRDPNGIFAKKKFFFSVEHYVIHVTFLGDNGRRGWIVDNMLRRYVGLQEFLDTRETFTAESKKKDRALYNAFFISDKKRAVWDISVQEAETLMKEPKHSRMTLLYEIIYNARLAKITPKSKLVKKNTEPSSDLSLSESLLDTLFSEDDSKDSTEKSRKSRKNSLDVSEVVTACLDNMAAKTGLSQIQKQSHMDRWLQKAKSNTPEKCSIKAIKQITPNNSLNEDKTKNSQKKKKRLRNSVHSNEPSESDVTMDYVSENGISDTESKTGDDLVKKSESTPLVNGDINLKSKLRNSTRSKTEHILIDSNVKEIYSDSLKNNQDCLNSNKSKKKRNFKSLYNFSTEENNEVIEPNTDNPSKAQSQSEICESPTYTQNELCDDINFVNNSVTSNENFNNLSATCESPTYTQDFMEIDNQGTGSNIEATKVDEPNNYFFIEDNSKIDLSLKNIKETNNDKSCKVILSSTNSKEQNDATNSILEHMCIKQTNVTNKNSVRSKPSSMTNSSCITSTENLEINRDNNESKNNKLYEDVDNELINKSYIGKKNEKSESDLICCSGNNQVTNDTANVIQVSLDKDLIKCTNNVIHNTGIIEHSQAPNCNNMLDESISIPYTNNNIESTKNGTLFDNNTNQLVQLTQTTEKLENNILENETAQTENQHDKNINVDEVSKNNTEIPIIISSCNNKFSEDTNKDTESNVEKITDNVNRDVDIKNLCQDITYIIAKDLPDCSQETFRSEITESLELTTKNTFNASIENKVTEPIKKITLTLRKNEDLLRPDIINASENTNFEIKQKKLKTKKKKSCVTKSATLNENSPEFLKYLELNRDTLLDENPVVSEHEIVSYLYKTWLYEQKLETDNSKINLNSKDLTQVNQVKPKSEIHKQKSIKKFFSTNVNHKTSDVTVENPEEIYVDHVSNKVNDKKINVNEKSDVTSQNTCNDNNDKIVENSPQENQKQRLPSIDKTDHIQITTESNQTDNQSNLNTCVKSKNHESTKKLTLTLSKNKNSFISDVHNKCSKSKRKKDKTDFTISPPKSAVSGEKHPEFLKYLELKRDNLLEENPHVAHKEMVAYLYKTWLYEQNLKTDTQKSDDLEQANLVKSIEEVQQETKKVTRQTKTDEKRPKVYKNHVNDVPNQLTDKNTEPNYKTADKIASDNVNKLNVFQDNNEVSVGLPDNSKKQEICTSINSKPLNATVESHIKDDQRILNNSIETEITESSKKLSLILRKNKESLRSDVYNRCSKSKRKKDQSDYTISPPKSAVSGEKHPEFLKYLELKRDNLLEENPHVADKEMVAYLYKTWLYEQNLKTDTQKSDDLEQANLVKSIEEVQQETKKVTRQIETNEKRPKVYKDHVDDVTCQVVHKSSESDKKNVDKIENDNNKLNLCQDINEVSVDLPDNNSKVQEISTDKNLKLVNNTLEVNFKDNQSNINSNIEDKMTETSKKLTLTLRKNKDLSRPNTLNGSISTNYYEIKPKKKKVKDDLTKSPPKSAKSHHHNDPEFLKYLELKKDALLDETPHVAEKDMISYLYKTWLYEQDMKTDMQKTDDLEQANLIKGVGEVQQAKKIKKKVSKTEKVQKNIDEYVVKKKTKRNISRTNYNENDTDIEDEIALFEISKKEEQLKKQSLLETEKIQSAENELSLSKTLSPEKIPITESESIGILSNESQIATDSTVLPYDELEYYLEQLLMPKPNIFKGLVREKVCEICEKVYNLVKCKGCHGMFHVDCVKNIRVISDEANELVKSQKKRGRKPKALNKSYCEGNDETLNSTSDDNNASFELKESNIVVDCDEFEKLFQVKMSEVLQQQIKEQIVISPSNNECDWTKTVPGKCEIVDAIRKPKIIDLTDFKCHNCQKYDIPVCFVCKMAVSPKNKNEYRQRCQVPHCNSYYHLECLDLWPQTQFNAGQLTKCPKSSEKFEAITCPRHVCHTCVCDDPRGCKTRFSSDKLAKCVRCPATYHSFTKCLPAGSQILTASYVICPRHYENVSGKVPCHVNTGWCFICALGGTLICCEYCPTSFHAECLNIKPPEGSYMCEDCETGRLPLFGEMVWVKLGNYRWWPGVVLHPCEIPDNVLAVKHALGEFVVRFFGQYDYYWVNRGRVFPFQEGDSGRITNQKTKINEAFSKAITHAKEAFEALKAAPPNLDEEAEIASSLLPPHYVKLKVNKPVGSLTNWRIEEDDCSLTQCECNPYDEEPCGMYSQCLNRMLLTECGPTCRAGDRCHNRAFERRQYPKMTPYRTPLRGWGLKTLQDIKQGEFVIEYVGELIDEAEFQRRMRRKHEMRDENYYFLTLDKDRMIDAGPKGNLARFMNHCCEPNCETQKWTVLGDVRVGLFAIRDIPANSEVTFNYNLECAGIEKKKCMCGARRCSGYIGAKPKQDDVPPKKSSQKRTYKKRKPIETTSPITSKKKNPRAERSRTRETKPKELTEIEKDLLIIKMATNAVTNNSDCKVQLVDIECEKSLKRKQSDICPISSKVSKLDNSSAVD